MTMEYLQVGAKAPLFSLKNQNGDKINLKDYLGDKNIVVYFYPRAMTPGCTVQACGVRDEKNSWKKLNAVVFGISPDKPEKLKKFQEKENLNFDLLSDEDHKIADAYQVWGKKKFMGKVFDGIHRVTFIIGKNGKIAHVMDAVKTKTHHEDLKEILKSL